MSNYESLFTGPELDGAIASAIINIPADLTASFDVDNALLQGGTYQPVNSASAVTITVPPGLTGPEPCTFEARGVGIVTFAPGAGVTINSLNGLLGIAGQYGAVTLVPQGADVYTLVGALG